MAQARWRSIARRLDAIRSNRRMSTRRNKRVMEGMLYTSEFTA